MLLNALEKNKKMDKVVNLTQLAMPHGNPQNEFDLVFGVDGKYVDVHSNYLGTPQSAFDINFGVDGMGIANPNKQIYTPQEINQIYKQSGSKQSLVDWLQSGDAKNLLDSLNKVVSTVKDATGGKGITLDSTDTKNLDTKDTNKKTETTIFGMSPITFGIFSLGFIAVASIVTISLMKRRVSKATRVIV